MYRYHDVFAQGTIPETHLVGEAREAFRDAILNHFTDSFGGAAFDFHIGLGTLDVVEITFRAAEDARKLIDELGSFHVEHTDKFGTWEFIIDTFDVD